MRVTVARTALAAAGLAVIGLVGSASAGTPSVGAKPLVITDPAGDSFGQPGDDLVKMTWSTTGTGTGKAYKPAALVVAVETSGKVGATSSLQYNVEGTVAGCGDFYFYTSPGSALLDGSAFGSCADDDSVDFTNAEVTSTDTTVTFTLPLGSVAGFKAGNAISGLVGYVGIVDPVTGEFGPAFLGADGASDVVSSDATYKIA